MIDELNYDQVLEELTKLSQATQLDNCPEILDKYLEAVAKNGDIVFPWEKLKPFLKLKLMQVMDRFNETYRLTDAELRTPNCKPFDYDEMKRDILKSVDWFVDAPFTIQRLCELLVAPNEYYRRTDKFLRGIEKNVMVVSTTQPRPSKYSPEPIIHEHSIRDFYQRYNASHAGHAYYSNGSRDIATGSASALNGMIETGLNNGGSNVAGGSSYANSSGTSYINSMSTLYDNHHAHAHHHHHAMGHGSGPLDPMADASASLGHSQHPQQHSPHHSPHHSSHLAPLQQLDSFTNVFAASSSTSSHHYTVNGDGGRSVSDPMGVSPMLSSQSNSTRWMSSTSPDVSKDANAGVRFSSLLHNAVSGGRGSPDDENIVVDDDDDDESDLDNTPEEEEEEEEDDDGDDEDEGHSSNKSIASFTDSGSNSSSSQDSSLVVANVVSTPSTTLISTVEAEKGDEAKDQAKPSTDLIERSTVSDNVEETHDALVGDAAGSVQTLEATCESKLEEITTEEGGVKKLKLEPDQLMVTVAEVTTIDQHPQHSAIIEAIEAEEVKVLENLDFQEVTPVEVDEPCATVVEEMATDESQAMLNVENSGNLVEDEEMVEPMEQE